MAQKVLQTNVEQGGWLGRIVERDDGTKVFLRGRKLDGGDGGGDGGDGGDGGLGEGERQADELLARQRTASEALLRRQREEGERQFQAAKQRSEQALGQFRTTIGGLERPEAIHGRVSEELGIPGIRESTKGLRQQIATAEGQLRELPEATRESLRGGLVTEGQRQRLIAKESIPITEQLQVLARTLGVESANLSEALSAAITQTQFTIQGQERLLEPERLNIQQVAQLNEQRLAMFSETAARELTAFNSQREAELDVLAEKLQNARTLSDQEFQRALELSKLDLEFENTKEELRLASQLTREETREEQKLLSAREIALKLTKAPKGLTGLKAVDADEEAEGIDLNAALSSFTPEERRIWQSLPSATRQAVLEQRARELQEGGGGGGEQAPTITPREPLGLFSSETLQQLPGIGRLFGRNDIQELR